ncbi:hypothetical protein AQJ46_19295 [Streptomyces canus]|uniref:Uncharacterized protein n=1 Tax=Streptomyces canus TaxID=58343 RepID=A0A117R421_9ACTN|nr:hypothetical protein AQJ46_19295 [Streptomyces canus]
MGDHELDLGGGAETADIGGVGPEREIDAAYTACDTSTDAVRTSRSRASSHADAWNACLILAALACGSE